MPTGKSIGHSIWPYNLIKTDFMTSVYQQIIFISFLKVVAFSCETTKRTNTPIATAGRTMDEQTSSEGEGHK